MRRLGISANRMRAQLNTCSRQASQLMKSFSCESCSLGNNHDHKDRFGKYDYSKSYTRALLRKRRFSPMHFDVVPKGIEDLGSCTRVKTKDTSQPRVKFVLRRLIVKHQQDCATYIALSSTLYLKTVISLDRNKCIRTKSLLQSRKMFKSYNVHIRLLQYKYKSLMRNLRKNCSLNYYYDCQVQLGGVKVPFLLLSPCEFGCCLDAISEKRQINSSLRQ